MMSQREATTETTSFKKHLRLKVSISLTAMGHKLAHARVAKCHGK